MREITALSFEKAKTIESKISTKNIIAYTTIVDECKRLYALNTETGDMLIEDNADNLEPVLKQEICKGNITESEMDFLIGFYFGLAKSGVVTLDKYPLSDIVIPGIEPAEDYKELLEREKRREITAEEIKQITRRTYTVK